MEVIYLNCGYGREYESDPRSDEHYLSSGFIWNQHSDQLALGLLAQLKSTAPVSQRSWVQIPYRPSFHYDLSTDYYCEDRFHIQKLHRNRLVGVPIVLV